MDYNKKYVHTLYTTIASALEVLNGHLATENWELSKFSKLAFKNLRTNLAAMSNRFQKIVLKVVAARHTGTSPQRETRGDYF